MHEPMEGSVALLETTYERHVAHLCCFIAFRAALMAGHVAIRRGRVLILTAKGLAEAAGGGKATRQSDVGDRSRG